MSAVLALPNAFTAHLALAAGVAVDISAHTLADLSQVVAKLQAEPANDAQGAALGNSNAQGRGHAHSPATTAAPADARKQTAAASTPTAAAAAGPSPASTAAGEAGNGAAGASAPATPDASTASSHASNAQPEVGFEQLKKAFLGLSTKANGRSLCEGVLKPFGLAKLSEAKPEQYAAVLAEITKAGA